MSETQNPQTSDQPNAIVPITPPESRGPNAHEALPQPLGEGQDAIHNYFMRNLQGEREGSYRPGEHSADPRLEPGQPPARQAQQGSDIQEVQAQPPALAEQPPEGPTVQESDPTNLPESYDEGFEVDGERYTAADIRALRQQLEEGTMRQDDYTRKTQMMGRVRQEHAALGEELSEFQAALERKSGIISQVVDANIQAYESQDISAMSPEQLQHWKQAYEQAKRGSAMLKQAFTEADNRAAVARDQVFNRISNSTQQMLMWQEPRWDANNEFYGALRKFVVQEGIMAPQQFDRENDFLRIVGLISMMDRAQLPAAIQETKQQTSPPDRQTNVPRDQRTGRFTRTETQAREAVLSSNNARRDGSAHNFFMQKLENERRQTGR
jgi:hypothetical protein